MKFKIITCPECNGRGYISRGESYDNGDGTGWGCHWSEECKVCNGERTIKIPMTNIDLIRTMSVEEMADWLIERDSMEGPVWCYNDCEAEDGCPHEKKCLINWLKSPAEEDHHENNH